MHQIFNYNWQDRLINLLGRENFLCNLVIQLSLKGEPGKRGLMFVSYYARSRAFISNYRSWKEYYTTGNIVEVATSLLSHETLHLIINRFSLSASAQLDNLFGKSNNWELCPHGLGDFDRLSVSTSSSRKYAVKKSPDSKKKR
jgi:hypothetical protein